MLRLNDLMVWMTFMTGRDCSDCDFSLTRFGKTRDQCPACIKRRLRIRRFVGAVLRQTWALLFVMLLLMTANSLQGTLFSVRGSIAAIDFTTMGYILSGYSACSPPLATY